MLCILGRVPFATSGMEGGVSPVVPWSAYDLSGGKWVPMPQLNFPSMASNSAWNLIAANGGLLCFVAPDARRILVCNPMVKTWRELPSVSFESRAPVISHMTVDKHGHSYKVVFAGNSRKLASLSTKGNAAYKEPDARCRMVDVYDSLSDSWYSAEKLPSDLCLKSGAYCDGGYYCLTRHLLTGLYRVVRLDLAKLTWSYSAISIPEGFENYPYIVACSGGVYLVGGSSEATDRMPMASIAIFQLDASLSRWNKVSEYSNARFLRSTGAIYGCGAHMSKVFVVTYAYDMWVAVYDVYKDVWEEPIKGNFFDMKDIFETRLTLQPNLRASP